MIEKERLISLFDFENRKAIFPNVHRSSKFSLITLGKRKLNRQSTFGFFLHDVLDIVDRERVFTLNRQDFLNINPNTKTTPIFRTRKDAELTAKIYSRVPVLVNEDKNQNPWGIRFKQGLFNMSSDSHLFKTESELKEMGFSLKGNRFKKVNELWLPLYESKMIWHYDHRFGSYDGVNSRSSTHTPTPTIEKYQNPNFLIKPWYWVDKKEVDKVTSDLWFLGFRDITNTTNERTVISTFYGLSSVGHTQPLILSNKPTLDQILFSGILSGVILDFFARQKIGGTHLTYNYFKQFPILNSSCIPEMHKETILSVLIELIYTSWDIKAIADEFWKEAGARMREGIQTQWEENQAATGGHIWELPEWKDAYSEIEWEREKGCPLPPFRWDEERRAQLKAELDAYFALLYGLERDELRYILDPQDVYGEDFPGETFRVLKEKEIRKYGEYRTRRLVLEAYDRLRPEWDMKGHLERLKEIWQDCQVDLSENTKSLKKENSNPKESKKSPLSQTDLFAATTPLFSQGDNEKITVGSKVTIRTQKAREIKYIIQEIGDESSHTPEGYQIILADSALALAMLGKREGDRFDFGGVSYKVKSVRN